MMLRRKQIPDFCQQKNKSRRESRYCNIHYLHGDGSQRGEESAQSLEHRLAKQKKKKKKHHFYKAALCLRCICMYMCYGYNTYTEVRVDVQP